MARLALRFRADDALAHRKFFLVFSSDFGASKVEVICREIRQIRCLQLSAQGPATIPTQKSPDALNKLAGYGRPVFDQCQPPSPLDVHATQFSRDQLFRVKDFW